MSHLEETSKGFDDVLGVRRGSLTGGHAAVHMAAQKLLDELTNKAGGPPADDAVRFLAEHRDVPREGAVAELMAFAQKRLSSMATSTRGMSLAVEFGIFDATLPGVERWLDDILSRLRQQATHFGSRPVGPSARPRYVPLLQWLYDNNGLEAVMGDGLRAEMRAWLVSNTGPDAGGSSMRALCDLAGRLFEQRICEQTVRWLDDHPEDPLLTAILGPDDSRAALAGELGVAALPRCVDVIEHGDLTLRLRRNLTLAVYHGGTSQQVEVGETPVDMSLARSVWGAYAYALADSSRA